MSKCFFESPFCDGPTDKAHLIPKQRLKKARLNQEQIWDKRVWTSMCRYHHHRFDNGFLRIPREDLPKGIEEYAAEHELAWSLDRDYESRNG